MSKFYWVNYVSEASNFWPRVCFLDLVGFSMIILSPAKGYRVETEISSRIWLNKIRENKITFNLWWVFYRNWRWIAYLTLKSFQASLVSKTLLLVPAECKLVQTLPTPPILPTSVNETRTRPKDLDGPPGKTRDGPNTALNPPFSIAAPLNLWSSTGLAAS